MHRWLILWYDGDALRVKVITSDISNGAALSLYPKLCGLEGEADVVNAVIELPEVGVPSIFIDGEEAAVEYDQ